MSPYKTLGGLADALEETLEKSRSILIYAPNTVGKTRLAQCIKERDPEGIVLYNSFIEDEFSWDNQRVVFKMNLESELLGTIVTQGLDGAIIKNFQSFMSDKIEPSIDFKDGEVSFGIHKGDDNSTNGIKISRAEESVFVWSVYFTVLNEAIDTLSDKPELRSTEKYDQVKCAVIDDPVSSMDDMRIVTVALALSDLIKKSSSLKFIVTTHHPLFFNVLFNQLRLDGGSKKNKAYILQRELAAGWLLVKQSKDSPFSYHMGIIKDIQQAISENSIERVHFNQFRTLLEKTANFLGYQGWGALLTGPDADLLIKILNLYSHDRFADPDASMVSEEYKDAFKSGFQNFLNEFRWASAS